MRACMRQTPGCDRSAAPTSAMLAALALLASVALGGSALAADIVPDAIAMPGTQPGEVGNLESPDKCDNCHGGYNQAVEPAFNWRGSMMGNAGRDPIFWATLAIAEQDFDGVGDLCIRCHSTTGWQAGRSAPTDGSGLAAADDNGVDCDTCHKMTNPNDTEHLGVMNPPFVANDGANPAEGYYGSGMLSLWGGAEKLGPYSDPAARHQFLKSGFHRSVDFCGSCHDVSNPVVGDVAPGHGTLAGAPAVIASGALSTPVDAKAAFNNPAYAYGVVERTFSEYKAGLWSQTRVADFPSLPEELRQGAPLAGYESALSAGTGGNYADNTTRYYSCQTCHLRPVNGPGCNKAGAPVRGDLPLHDMTGGNYWMAEAIMYQDLRGQLRLGGGLSALQRAALDAGATRAMKQLSEAAALHVTSGSGQLTVRITNLTGHKLITGYPEGRRMWLRVSWYDDVAPLPIRVDGEWGPLFDPSGAPVTVVDPASGLPVQVSSLRDLHDPNTTIYEAHYGVSQAWANVLLGLLPGDHPLGYDRASGEVDVTLGELAAAPEGTVVETFHFALNNTVIKDNRIPPYGFRYDIAQTRNALPVPADQFGAPGPGGSYEHWDEVVLSPAVGATYAVIDLLYQPTSWEYVQFLDRANAGQSAFLADEGRNFLEAWLNTGMAEPYVMASTVWGAAPTPAEPSTFVGNLATFAAGKRGALTPATTFKTQGTVVLLAQVLEEGGETLDGAQVFMEVFDSAGEVVTGLQGFSAQDGTAELRWKVPRRQAPGIYQALVVDVIKSGYLFDSQQGVREVAFTIQ